MDVQLKALSDQIAHIREVAVQNLEVLVKLFGEDWMQEYIMPSISDASKRSGPSGYLGRITALHAVGALSAVMPPPFLCDVLLPQVLAFDLNVQPARHIILWRAFQPLCSFHSCEWCLAFVVRVCFISALRLRGDASVRSFPAAPCRLSCEMLCFLFSSFPDVCCVAGTTSRDRHESFFVPGSVCALCE